MLQFSFLPTVCSMIAGSCWHCTLMFFHMWPECEPWSEYVTILTSSVFYSSILWLPVASEMKDCVKEAKGQRLSFPQYAFPSDVSTCTIKVKWSESLTQYYVLQGTSHQCKLLFYQKSETLSLCVEITWVKDSNSCFGDLAIVALGRKHKATLKWLSL